MKTNQAEILRAQRVKRKQALESHLKALGLGVHPYAKRIGKSHTAVYRILKCSQVSSDLWDIIAADIEDPNGARCSVCETDTAPPAALSRSGI
jgi:hypothetical protein